MMRREGVRKETRNLENRADKSTAVSKMSFRMERLQLSSQLVAMYNGESGITGYVDVEYLLARQRHIELLLDST